MAQVTCTASEKLRYSCKTCESLRSRIHLIKTQIATAVSTYLFLNKSHQKFGEPQITTCKKQWWISYQLEKTPPVFSSDLQQTHASVYPTRRLWSEQVQRLWWRLLKLGNLYQKLKKKYGCHNRRLYIFRFVYFLPSLVTCYKFTLSSRSGWKRGPQSPTAACGRVVRASVQQARSKTSKIFGCEIYRRFPRLFQQKLEPLVLRLANLMLFLQRGCEWTLDLQKPLANVFRIQKVGEKTAAWTETDFWHFNKPIYGNTAMFKDIVWYRLNRFSRPLIWLLGATWWLSRLAPKCIPKKINQSFFYFGFPEKT